MEHDHLGQQPPITPVPLQGELDVSPGGVAMVVRVVPNMVTARTIAEPWKNWKNPIGTYPWNFDAHRVPTVAPSSNRTEE